MALRLIKLYLPDGNADEVATALAEHEVLGHWTQQLDDGFLEVTVLPRPDRNEEVLDTLSKHYSSRDGYRLVLLPVAVSLPHANEEDEGDEEEEQASDGPDMTSESKHEQGSDGSDLSDVSNVEAAANERGRDESTTTTGGGTQASAEQVSNPSSADDQRNDGKSSTEQRSGGNGNDEDRSSEEGGGDRGQDERAEKRAESEQVQEKSAAARISREELYADAISSTELTRVYLVLVLLSAVVAAAGMIRNNPSVIIGAMVIAPLLGPNVAFSLATTLGDVALARRAAIIGTVGVGLALAFSVLVGWLFSDQLFSAEIAARTGVNLSDIAIALAAGAAGALSFTTGVPAALIGVMVAVALLPPLVSFGMLLGGGHFSPALGAGLLFSVNVICVNLAGVATFLAQGIKPASWLEARSARRATVASISLWLTLLVILIAIIVFADPASRLRLSLPD